MLGLVTLKSENNGYKVKLGLYDSRAIAEIYWASGNRIDHYHRFLIKKMNKAKGCGNYRTFKKNTF